MRLVVLHEFAFIWFEVKKFLTSNYLDKPRSGCYTAKEPAHCRRFLFPLFHHCQK
jgi:hypothetical protein